MLLSRRLPKFFRKIDNLCQIISGVDDLPSRNLENTFSAEKALIQIQIEWEHFVRHIILDSATGNFLNGSGRVHSLTHPNLRSREAAAHALIATYQKRTYEPEWYLPADAISAAIRLGLSNQHQIAAELGIAPWPIDDLRHLRNFIAHQSKRSAMSVRGAGLAGQSGSINVLNVAYEYTNGGTKRYIEWANFTKGVAARLVE